VIEIPYFSLQLLGTATLWLRRAVGRSKERARLWTLAAEDAGLTDVAVSTVAGLAWSLSGKAAPLEVRLEWYASNAREGNRVIVTGFGHGSAALSFDNESFSSNPRKALLRPPPIALGDRDFDEALHLYGSPELACALFDAPTRRLIGRLVQGCLEGPGRPALLDFAGKTSLENGALRMEIHDSPQGNAAMRLSEALPKLLAAAQRLIRPADLAGRMVQNLRDDPVPAVRLTNLRLLLASHRDHPLAEEALVGALKDSSEEIRLQAAQSVGERGRDTLLEIASGEHSDDQRAAQAIAALGERFPVERAKDVLARALSIGRPATARACVQVLAGTDAGAAEAPLIEALAADSLAVLVAVAEALERVGTAAAVMPLREASERRREGELRRAARQAIAGIQARLQDAAPGQLSLAAGDAGQVSLIEDDLRGQVSLPDKP